MTYCIGMKVHEGLVMIADSRTNAGVDHISTFRKMHTWEDAGNRVMILLSAGNLSITQTVVTLLQEGVQDPKSEELRTMDGAPGLLRAAQLVGDAVREVYRMHGKDLAEQGVDFNASFILGGQVKGRQPRLFLIYAAGNFIEATEDTPFFQIGETKYGKPILDRVLSARTSLIDAAKLGLISMDSTLRSNISVGLPVDLIAYETGQLKITKRLNLDQDNAYFRQIQTHWGQALSKAFKALPDPEF